MHPRVLQFISRLTGRHAPSQRTSSWDSVPPSRRTWSSWRAGLMIFEYLCIAVCPVTGRDGLGGSPRRHRGVCEPGRDTGRRCLRGRSMVGAVDGVGSRATHRRASGPGCGPLCSDPVTGSILGEIGVHMNQREHPARRSGGPGRNGRPGVEPTSKAAAGRDPMLRPRDDAVPRHAASHDGGRGALSRGSSCLLKLRKFIRHPWDHNRG